VIAQQPDTVKRKTPRLTADDVARSRSQPGGAVVVRTVDLNKVD